MQEKPQKQKKQNAQKKKTTQKKKKQNKKKKHQKKKTCFCVFSDSGLDWVLFLCFLCVCVSFLHVFCDFFGNLGLDLGFVFFLLFF